MHLPLCIVHCALGIWHCALCTWHLALCIGIGIGIVHCALCIWYLAFGIWHLALTMALELCWLFENYCCCCCFRRKWNKDNIGYGYGCRYAYGYGYGSAPPEHCSMHVYGYTHRLCALECDPDETAVVHNAARIVRVERWQPTKGGFADLKTVLVDVTHNVVRF